jgi:hypothetical protein
MRMERDYWRVQFLIQIKFIARRDRTRTFAKCHWIALTWFKSANRCPLQPFVAHGGLRLDRRLRNFLIQIKFVARADRTGPSQSVTDRLDLVKPRDRCPLQPFVAHDGCALIEDCRTS